MNWKALFVSLACLPLHCMAEVPKLECQSVVVGVLDAGLETQEARLVDETILRLKQRFGACAVVSDYMTAENLRAAIDSRRVDLVVSTSKFFRQMAPSGLRPLVAIVRPESKNPNAVSAGAVVVPFGRTDVKTLEDLKGKKVIAGWDYGRSGMDSVLGELAASGFDSAKFFVKVESGGTDAISIVGSLERGEFDAAILPACALERLTQSTPLVRVVEPRQHAELSCAHSTSVYPGMTVSAMPTLPAELSGQIAQVLLEMPRVQSEHWGLGADYSSLDRMLRLLDLDAYAQARRWTVGKIFSEYWQAMVALLLALAALIAHSVRVEFLVRRRTQQLSESIQEQKRLRQEAATAAIHMEKLQKIGTIGQMSSLFAHEIRQPLNSIICYAYALSKAAKRHPEDDMLQEASSELQAQANRANAIVQKLRDSVKNRAGTLKVLDWTESVRLTLKNFESSLVRPAAISFDEHGRVPIFADELDMEIIALNLLRNAFEAQSKNTSPSIWVSVAVSGVRAVLTVEDGGSGLRDENLEKIRASLMSSTKPEGLGLGLSIVRFLSDAHSGNVRFDRSSHGGLKASVSMPLFDGDSHVR